jgi:hypothetical protein
MKLRKTYSRPALLGAILLSAFALKASAQNQADEAVREAEGQVGQGSPTVITQPSFNPFAPYGAPGIDQVEDASRVPDMPGLPDPPVTEQGFAFGAGPAATFQGGKDSPVILGPSGPQYPELHLVRPGDTLWGLSENYYENPWQWPQMWSQNPQIKNPHWIYPGDQVRLRGGASALGAPGGVGGAKPMSLISAPPGLIDRTPLVPKNTIFIRSLGYIGDPEKEEWGELVGGRMERKIFTQGNNVYIQMREGVNLRIGQLLSIYNPLRGTRALKGVRQPEGEVVAYLGTVKVTFWDPETGVARARLIESIDPIERGAKVGPIGRRFDVISPARADVSVWTRIVTTIYPHVLFGQNQLVFIDKGSDDGLRSGNRLFVVRKGDQWRRDLSSAERTRALHYAEGVSIAEKTPLNGNEEGFPEEIIGELRILRANKTSSVAMVVASAQELFPGDRAVARKGY